MRSFNAAYGVLRKINTACVWGSCALIALITLFILWQVITRYFFRQPAMWTFPVTEYMLLYAVMLGAAFTLQQGGHVRVEVVLEILPRSIRVWVERLAHLLGLAFVLVLLNQSVRHTLRVLAEGGRDISALSIPLWVPAVGVTFGLGLLTVTYVFVAIESFFKSEDELPAGPGRLQDSTLKDVD